ncbi:hypothetical protein RRG08_025316 [Elysia crispata]|uniref:Alpha-2-macroglobulin bait region domain-containing protein n=1 Tax=Elysia crispata TaxID=231223 RepID=A0AAE1DUY3_9GAST|nr:hypothetical protein RRG08_025316 [Elysia crispata]
MNLKQACVKQCRAEKDANEALLSAIHRKTCSGWLPVPCGEPSYSRQDTKTVLSAVNKAGSRKDIGILFYETSSGKTKSSLKETRRSQPVKSSQSCWRKVYSDVMAVIVILSAIMALALGQRPAVLPQLVKEELTTASPLVFNGTYWLAMSNKIRPGIPFQISAQLLDGQSPVQVTVIIKDQKGVQTILQDAFTVNSGDVETFGIDIPLDIQPPAEMDDRYWYQPYYQVHVKGEGQDIYFKHSTQVQFEQKAFSTFIQTDKGMYKPGQKVMFRVLTVFPDMKAVRGEPYDIYIKDSDDNRIRQWLGVQDPNGRGVIELWLQLADEIPTGDWTIVASIMGKEETKTFTVDDYVLPRFEVEVQLPSFALAYDQLLKIRVKATYTFGQPVSDGAVKIAIKSVYQWAKDEVLYKKGKLSKDGTLTIEVAHKEIMSMLRENYQFLSSLNSQRIKVEAEVTESQTGRMQNSSSIVQFFDTPMKLRFVEEVAPDHFKPGLPYTIYTEVRKQDDTRFPEDVSKLMKIYFNVTYEIPLTEEELAEQREQQNSNSGTSSSSSSSGKLVADIEPGIPGRYYYPRTKTMMLHLDEAQRVQSVPANGWITLSFDTPREATQVTIEAWSTKPYKELRTSKWLSRAVSPSDSFLHLQVGTEKPTAGAEFTVTAISTDVIPMLTYQIFSKGALLQTTVVPAPPGNSSSVDFSFMVTRNMTPSISLVAFYVREENQEVVVDALSLSVNGLFQNPITVEFTQQEAEPGDKVEVIVKAAADSLVYLLSADKSAILLKGGNDLTQDDVSYHP